MILREGDDTDCLFIVESGLLELRTEIDGNVFSLLRLPQGTVINQKNFFLDDEQMQVTLIAIVPSQVLVFEHEQLEVLRIMHPELQ